MGDRYEPTWESLDTHEVPEWYDDAKLGIFIHWGVYSVPAWAPKDASLRDREPDESSPYAEWYPYYMYEEGSETWEYHREQYGEDVEYIDFAEDFTAENWDPEEWAEFFADVGAGYVVLTGEHHDGFPLWDTHYTKYSAAEMGPERDLVGDLAEAVRERDLKFSASYHANLNYYQPGFEGRFGHPDYRGGANFREDEVGPGSEYVDFMNAKHRELIRKYDLDLLWFDVPRAEGDHVHAQELIADYYNRAEERGKGVVVNDRSATDAHREHADFYTPEYETFEEITEHKWESCRGIGQSFGYNETEGPEDHLSVEELIHSFVDIVSKNGNLLINVGPKADGTIPEVQRERLAGLGEWLDANGEAIFGTTYWAVAEDDDAPVEVRYTWRDDTLYAVCLDWPGERLELSVGDHVDLDGVDGAEVLGSATDVGVSTEGGLVLSLPAEPPRDAHAYAIAVSGVPNPRD
jgi:alpha-L-fucosidase